MVKWRRKLSPEAKEEIQTLKGVTCAELAAKYGVSVAWVRMLRAQVGLTRQYDKTIEKCRTNVSFTLSDESLEYLQQFDNKSLVVDQVLRYLYRKQKKEKKRK